MYVLLDFFAIKSLFLVFSVLIHLFLLYAYRRISKKLAIIGSIIFGMIALMCVLLIVFLQFVLF